MKDGRMEEGSKESIKGATNEEMKQGRKAAKQQERK